MSVSAIALESQVGDDKPVLIGQLPKAGTYGLVVQFAKFQATDADRKLCENFFDYCDGDGARPLYIVDAAKAKDIRNILNKLGNRVRVVEVVTNDKQVYAKANTQMEFRFYRAWMAQLLNIA